MKPRSPVARVLLASLALVACGSPHPKPREQAATGPTLVALDSILLIESDTEYIGRPYSPAVDPYDGSFYIPDIFASRVQRFGRDGRLLVTYGGPGDGPGEFGTPLNTFVLDDSTVAVHDEELQRLNLFDRTTGVFRTSMSLPYVLGTTPGLVQDDVVWFAIGDPSHQVTHSIGRVDLSSDSLALLGPMPADFTVSIEGGYWSYANALLRGALTRRGDVLVRGWGARNEFVLLDLGDMTLDTLKIPVLRRRGVPADVRDRYDIERLGLRERFELHSHLRQLWTRPDGSLAFTHHDQKVTSLVPTPVFSARVWVGVISSDFTHACVDGELNVSRDTRSMETFRGDTLFQLDRRITTGEQLETWVRAFLVDATNCDWIVVD